MNPQPSPSRARALRTLVSFVCPLALAPAVWSQTAPRILHEGVTCMVSGRNLVLEALVEPADELVTVKAYFRAEIYPAFFYVEMARTGDRYQGVLPRPTRETQAVVYYLEAVDSAFNSLRTEEFRPRVVLDANDCRDDGPPATYLDGPASITVGATTAGSSFPPGFLTEGIVATISSAGRAVVGGGAGAGTFAAVGAAAGTAVGVGILASGGDTTTTVPASGGITTTVSTTTALPATTTTPPGSLDACFETQPSPPTIPVGGTVRFDASCSGPDRERIVTYFWTFGDGRDSREGRVVTRVYNTPGVFTAELTVTDTAGAQDRTSQDVRVEENVAPPPPSGGGSSVLTISKGGPPAANVGVAFNYSITVSNASGGAMSGVVMTDAVPPSLTINNVSFTAAADNCAQAANTVTCNAANLPAGVSFTVTITVTPTAAGGVNNTANATSVSPPANVSSSHTTAIALKAFAAQEAAVVSEIQSPSGGDPGEIRGSLELNRSETAATDGAGPKRHVFKVQRGANVLSGYVTGASLEGALWRLDFSTAEGFVPGSLVVEAGDVVATGGAYVVFRLGGGEARVRVRFRLE